MVDLLRQVPPAWPIIVHPEVIETLALWESFGSQVSLENMDNRKTSGRTVAEMRELFRLSEVGGRGEHLSVSPVAGVSFRKLAHRVPSDCPIIIESVIGPEQIDAELSAARELFNGEGARAIAVTLH